MDTRSTFKKEIVKTLVNGYKEGITPSPCSRCNRSVKFPEMLKWAKDNCQTNRIATGHYARLMYAEENYSEDLLPGDGYNRHKLLRGVDTNKDQSYFLYDLEQEFLKNVVFPLGELTKEETRKAAIKYQLRTATKTESQDLCLAEHHGSMKAFLDHYVPSREGEIVLKDGSIIGSHDGIEHFTIGQRKGLGISWKEPLHVIEIDSLSNKVIVAPRNESWRSDCIVGEVNWVSISPPKYSINIEVQLRYRSKAIPAKVTPIDPEKKDLEKNRPYRCKIEFYDNQFSITPGQAAVFYSKDVLLGGGIIQK